MKLEDLKVTFFFAMSLIIIVLTYSHLLSLKRTNEILVLLTSCDDPTCECACHEIVVE